MLLTAVKMWAAKHCVFFISYILPHNVILLRYLQNIIFKNQSPRKGLEPAKPLQVFVTAPISKLYYLQTVTLNSH